MNKGRIGIIGGSGLYQIPQLKIIEKVDIATPFGNPSHHFLLGQINEREVVFIPRHGEGHKLLPSEINYRANIWGMKKLGVEWIISISAVGSFHKKIRPQDIVLVDQFVDRTTNRKCTFFGDGIAAHVVFAHPVCDCLRKAIYDSAAQVTPEKKLHWGGTYLNIEGPAFSTKAESLLFKSWGVDVIGMTNITEAKCAREAEICYATIAMVTDYDCWIEGEPEALVHLNMIIQNLQQNTETARLIIQEVVRKIPEKRECLCATALKDSIITDPGAISGDVKKKLDLLIGKY